MRFNLIFTICLFLSLVTNAQEQEDNFIKILIESLAENLPEDYDLSELQDRFTFYTKHPINLNKTTPEKLKELVFLSPLQISNLFAHLKLNGKF